jgi:hypothetical protein
MFCKFFSKGQIPRILEKMLKRERLTVEGVSAVLLESPDIRFWVSLRNWNKKHIYNAEVDREISKILLQYDEIFNNDNGIGKSFDEKLQETKKQIQEKAIKAVYLEEMKSDLRNVVKGQNVEKARTGKKRASKNEVASSKTDNSWTSQTEEKSEPAKNVKKSNRKNLKKLKGKGEDTPKDDIIGKIDEVITDASTDAKPVLMSKDRLEMIDNLEKCIQNCRKVRDELQDEFSPKLEQSKKLSKIVEQKFGKSYNLTMRPEYIDEQVKIAISKLPVPKKTLLNFNSYKQDLQNYNNRVEQLKSLSVEFRDLKEVYDKLEMDQSYIRMDILRSTWQNMCDLQQSIRDPTFDINRRFTREAYQSYISKFLDISKPVEEESSTSFRNDINNTVD